jgi:uncharacterized membrane protein YdjX (TVP38/TMEM64 family)
MAYFIGILVGAAPAFVFGWFFGARSAYKRIVTRRNVKIMLDGLQKRDVL